MVSKVWGSSRNPHCIKVCVMYCTVLSRSKTRRARREVLRQNRRNPELEIQARTEKCEQIGWTNLG